MATTSDSEGVLRELGEKDAAQDAGQPATSSASPPESSVPKAETGELETESPRTVTGLKVCAQLMHEGIFSTQARGK